MTFFRGNRATRVRELIYSNLFRVNDNYLLEKPNEIELIEFFSWHSKR